MYDVVPSWSWRHSRFVWEVPLSGINKHVRADKIPADICSQIANTLKNLPCKTLEIERKLFIQKIIGVFSKDSSDQI